MDENENRELYEEIKEELDENLDHPQDNMFLAAVMGQEEISIETIAAMWPNTTMGEFAEEMKRHGLTLSLSRKKREEPKDSFPSPEEVERIHLTGEMEDTPENRKRYLKVREMAREKLGDSGIVESFLETEPVDQDAPLDEAALEELNAASYQGDFADLRELSQKLKENKES